MLGARPGGAASSRADSAFTLTFDQADYDEGRNREGDGGAGRAPTSTRSRSGSATWPTTFADAIAQSETLCVNAHGVAKYLLSRAVRDAGYKVVITGEGSDEILGGYPHFRRDMLLYNREGQDPDDGRSSCSTWLDEHNTVSRGLLLPDGEVGPLDGVRRILGFVPSWIETFSVARGEDAAAACAETSIEQIRRAASGACAILDDIDVRGQLAGRDAVHQSLYLWAKTVLAGYILTMLGDRMEMAHSIEGRVPFLDHHVVEVIASQPVNQKIRGMTEKFVLREAVQDVITRHRLQPAEASVPEPAGDA